MPVFPFAYDWRQPLEELHSQLSHFIDEVIDRTKLLRHYHDEGYGKKTFPSKVNLVGHAMGGVIISGYLKANGFERVSKVATIATPFRGSLEAVAKTTMGIAASQTSLSVPLCTYRVFRPPGGWCQALTSRNTHEENLAPVAARESEFQGSWACIGVA